MPAAFARSARPSRFSPAVRPSPLAPGDIQSCSWRYPLGTIASLLRCLNLGQCRVYYVSQVTLGRFSRRPDADPDREDRRVARPPAAMAIKNQKCRFRTADPALTALHGIILEFSIACSALQRCIKAVISIGYPVGPTKLQQSGRTS